MPVYGNNYFPVNYQPAQITYPQQMIQGQPIQNVQPMQNIQPVQQAQNQSSILWVRNQQEAAMYPVAPNNAVALWDSGAPAIYLKQADASGKPSMKIYDLVERPETPQTEQIVNNNSEFATKSELAALANIVKDVDSIITSIRDEVNALKVKAPSKRIAKKEENNE